MSEITNLSPRLVWQYFDEITRVPRPAKKEGKIRAFLIDFAKKQLQVKLILVDGKMLTNLMIQYNLGVSVVKTYEIKQLDVDYFEGEMI